jgi:hypothetical protein
MTTTRTFEPLLRWEKRAIVGFFLVVLLLGAMVLKRSAFMERRMGDLGVYLRSAWAVRTGNSLYSIAEENGWHYVYPPLFAILMTPLADPPAGADSAGMLPYPVSVTLWYAISVGAIALGVHWLANALEEHTLPEPDRSRLLGSRRWWALRLVPVFGCCIPLGHSLMRGQVNPIVVMCLCASMAALMKGKSWRAGWWLAWPICIKVFPAMLLLFPLMQRNWRCLGGCLAGLLVGLVAIPLAFLGPQRTHDYYAEFCMATLAPGLGIGDDSSRSDELTRITATDSQSFLAMLHNTIHSDRDTRPLDASVLLRRVSYGLGAAVLLITLWCGGWGRRAQGLDIPLYLGSLVMVMLFVCPVCHLHYYSMALPLVMAIVAAAWKNSPVHRLGWGLNSLLLVNVAINIVPSLPGCALLRERGLSTLAALIDGIGCDPVCLRERGFSTWAALLLWTVALVLLWRRTRSCVPVASDAVSSSGLAA